MSRCLDIALHIEGALQRYSERHPIAWSLFIAKIKGARVSVPLSFEQSELLLGILKTAEDNQADAERWRALLRTIERVEDESGGEVFVGVPPARLEGEEPPLSITEFISMSDGEREEEEPETTDQKHQCECTVRAISGDKIELNFGSFSVMLPLRNAWFLGKSLYREIGNAKRNHNQQTNGGLK